jgi:transposase
VGYKVHLTETGDIGQPDLITQVLITPATTPDGVMGPTIHHDLAQRDLLPGTHLQQLLTATAMNVVRVIAWL